jgi:very-short-patch-repair endonuclease
MEQDFLYNNRALRERRRELRNNQTEAEKILWTKISRNQLNGLRFLRQYGVGPYILDFYCPKMRLCIEVDGSVHKGEDPEIYDKEREKYLESVEITVIRFWNSQIMKNIELVVQKIEETVKTLEV